MARFVSCLNSGYVNLDHVASVRRVKKGNGDIVYECHSAGGDVMGTLGSAKELGFGSVVPNNSKASLIEFRDWVEEKKYGFEVERYPIVGWAIGDDGLSMIPLTCSNDHFFYSHDAGVLWCVEFEDERDELDDRSMWYLLSEDIWFDSYEGAAGYSRKELKDRREREAAEREEKAAEKAEFRGERASSE